MGAARGNRGSGGLAAFIVIMAAFGLWWFTRDGSQPRVVTPEVPDRAVAASGPGWGFDPGVSAARARIAGQVRDGSGDALVAAEVCAQAKQLDALAAPRHCAATDDAGRYVIEALPGGPYSVVASAPRHASQWSETDPLVLGPAEDREGVDFVLRASEPNVRGVVRDALGGTVAGARVRVAMALPPYQVAEAETDDDGGFALYLAEGPAMATATAEGYAPAELSGVVPAARMELTLTPGGRIAGIVQTPDGRPVADARVSPDHGGVLNARSRLQAMTDFSGEFELQGLPPGAYRLVAKGPRAQGTADQTVFLGLADSVDGVVITVQPASRVLGRVQIEGSGAPCPQGSVMLSGMPDPMQGFPEAFMQAGAKPQPVPTQVANIGAEGEVEFSGVPAGTYYAVVRCDEHRFVEGPESVTVQAKAEDLGPLDWFVVPASTLTVRAVDGRGQPVGRQPLRLLMPPPAPGMGRGMLQMMTDAEGVVRVPDLRPGDYAVGPMDSRLGDNVEVEVAEGEREVQVDLPLHGSASLVVTAVDDGERPIEGLSVVAVAAHAQEGEDALRRQSGVALGAGRYAIGPLVPGMYRVEATDGINPTFGADGHGLRVLAGERAELTLRVNRGGRIRGRVTGADGVVVGDVWVSAEAAEDGPRPSRRPRPSGGRVLTDERGAFELGGLSEAGTYTVTALEPYGSEVSVEGVATGETVELQLPPTGSLEGRLRAEDGSPARVHLARATSADGRVERMGHVSNDGLRFAIDSLPIGEVRVLATSTDGQMVSARVRVEPGDEPTRVELALAEAAAEGAQPGPRPGVGEDTPARAD